MQIRTMDRDPGLFRTMDRDTEKDQNLGQRHRILDRDPGLISTMDSV